MVVGAGAFSFGFGFACFSDFGFEWPCACDGGTAGVAGVAGLEFGGLADVARTAGVARSCVPDELGLLGGGEAGDVGALTVGGADEVPPPVVPPPEVGCPPVVGGVAPGDGTGPAGVPPPDDGPGKGLRALTPVGPPETKIGVKPEKTGAATRETRACGRAGETRTGTVRTCELGTESSRAADRSSALKACSQSCADATAPATTAPA